jgi:hypothetical protein
VINFISLTGYQLNWSAVLHPGLKLEYFRLQHWEDDWIEAAENLTREEYINKYEKHTLATEDLSDNERNKVRTHLSHKLLVQKLIAGFSRTVTMDWTTLAMFRLP